MKCSGKQKQVAAFQHPNRLQNTPLARGNAAEISFAVKKCQDYGRAASIPRQSHVASQPKARERKIAKPSQLLLHLIAAGQLGRQDPCSESGVHPSFKAKEFWKEK